MLPNGTSFQADVAVRVGGRYNSFAIECFLDRIPGLAEHFIYLNDDMFFGNHVTVSHTLRPSIHMPAVPRVSFCTCLFLL